MKPPVYLDYAATTPVDPEVAEAMSACLTQDGNFGNAASRSHAYGWKAEEAVENARGELAELIGADTREIVWTSGATEANNLAIKGVAMARQKDGRHLVTSAVEHKAVLDSFKYLESVGWSVTYLAPESDGRIDPAALENVIRKDTVLVSLMHVNNETGVINDISAFGEICKANNVVFHVDAAQSVGKIAIDTQTLPADLLSISAHKFYGPKGIGALYVRRSPTVNLIPQIHGGGHERGMRSGTLATHQIVGLGKAAAVAQKNMGEENARILTLRNAFIAGFCGFEGWQINGSLEHRIAGNINIGFEGVDGEALLMSLRELALSTGSACTSLSVEPSYVLMAMGLSEQMAHSSLRISLGRYTTEEDVAFAFEKIRSAVSKLREKSKRRASA